MVEIVCSSVRVFANGCNCLERVFRLHLLYTVMCLLKIVKPVILEDWFKRIDLKEGLI